MTSFTTLCSTIKSGIHSIPTLIVDGQYMISGAERSDGIYDLLVQAVEKGISGSRIFGDITVV